MSVPTFPTFRFILSSLIEEHKDEIERVRNTMVSAVDSNGENVSGYIPNEGEEHTAYFYLELRALMDDLKHFEIEDDVKELLLRTRPPRKPELHLPFDVLYLDVKFEKEELEGMGFHLDADSIQGIVLRRGDIMYYNKTQPEVKPVVVGKDLRISVASTDIRDDGKFLSITTFPSKIEVRKDFKMKVELDIDKTAISLNDQKLIADFAVNFLYFINNPDVKYRYVERSEKNIQRRIREHKPILPSSYKITLTGESLRYLNEIKAGLRTECQYAFDVRGHYRQLQSPFYKQKRGVRIWVSHFVKGKDKGFIVEKYYDLDNKNNKEVK